MVNNCPSNPTPDIPPDPPFDVYVVEGSDEGPGTEPGRTEADDATDTETTSKGVVEVEVGVGVVLTAVVGVVVVVVGVVVVVRLAERVR